MTANYIHTLRNFLNHLLKAKGSHDLHSPFVYALYTGIIKKSHSRENEQIESLRELSKSDQRVINQIDFKNGTSKKTSVGHVAKTSSSSSKFSTFLSGLSTLLSCQSILEAGTSLGFNAMYQSLPTNVKKVVTLEGNPDIVKVAQENLNIFGSSKIEIIHGNVYDSFAIALKDHKPDLIFIDADHRPEALTFYFEAIAKQTDQVKCIVIHDIYWSIPMTTYWNELLKNPEFTLTLDIFEAGLLFPHYPIEKQHFRLKF